MWIRGPAFLGTRLPGRAKSKAWRAGDHIGRYRREVTISIATFMQNVLTARDHGYTCRAIRSVTRRFVMHRRQSDFRRA